MQMIDGKWDSADNRRLWVFKRLKKFGECETIPVEVRHMPLAKHTSENDGLSVDIRGDPGGSSSPHIGL